MRARRRLVIDFLIVIFENPGISGRLDCRFRDVGHLTFGVRVLRYIGMKHALTALILLSAPALADCPPAPDISASQDKLLAEVRVAPNEGAARVISDKLWALWATAPDDKAQGILDRGMAARVGYDFASALDAFDDLTEYCPDYAEGYNQRAFVNFLRQDYETALVDLDKAIDLSPQHIAAIAGKALTLIGLERDEDAQRVLREALALNPWLAERRYLTDPDGRDL